MSTRFESLEAAFDAVDLPNQLARYLQQQDQRTDYLTALTVGGLIFDRDLGAQDPLAALEGCDCPAGASVAVVVTSEVMTSGRLIVVATADTALAATFVWREAQVDSLGDSVGLLPDALLRTLGIETEAPSFSTNRFWVLVWLAELLTLEGDLDIWKCAELHPAVFESELTSLSNEREVCAFLEQRHRDHVSMADWTALRDDAVSGWFPFYWLPQVALAAWHDDGSFARSVQAETWGATEALLHDPKLPHASARRLVGRLTGLLD